MIRWCTVLLVLSFLIHCGGGSAPQDDPITVQLESDSICAAMHIPYTCKQSLQLADPTMQVEDHAVVGMTLRRLADSGFYTTVPKGRYVILTLGGNDALDNYSEDEYRAELVRFVRYVKGQNSIPILTGAPEIRAYGPDYFPQTQFFDQAAVDRLHRFNQVVRDVCQQENVTDARWDTVQFDPLTDTVDGIHRTQDANNRLVYRLYEVLLRLHNS